MSKVHQFLEKLQANGEITDDKVPAIRQKISADGRLDLEDVKLLVELYCDAHNCSPKFDELFFSVLERVFLTDGEIQPSEEFYLLKMLYSDREIRQPEKDFLQRLRKKLPNRSESFENLYATAMAAPAKNWSVGGSGA
jgi:hypothetical protein